MRHFLIVMLIVLIMGCEGKPNGTPQVANPDAVKKSTSSKELDDLVRNIIPMEERKTYTREEFKKLVMGKTKDEIRKVLGQPDSTTDLYWQYEKLTRDPDSKKKSDELVMVWFKDDKGDAVTFN